MLWYNAWLETRWRFVIGSIVLMFYACGMVLGYPQALKAVLSLPRGDGEMGRRIAESGALFTLSLPVSRDRLLGVRAATALAELFILALVPSLTIPLLSPVIGQTYSVADAIVYGTSLFVAGSVLFSFAFLLSTVFSDVWRPPLIALCVVVGLRLIEQAVGWGGISFLAFMTAESYFHGHGLPWLGLLVSAAISAAMLYGAARNLARHDF